MDLRKKLGHESRLAGLKRIGIAGVHPFAYEENVLNERLQQGLITKSTAGDVVMRTHPDKVLPGAKSIVCVGAYYRLPDERRQDSRLARYARVTDYHKVLTRALIRLAEVIQQEAPEAKHLISVDTGPLVERAVAERAGLGFIGKNCSLIVPDTGSYLVLGALISTVSITPDEPMNSGCGDCRACLEACPTGALESPGIVREERCLSYITQKRGWIAAAYRPYIQQSLWGCDICQSVCPHNQSDKVFGQSLWDPIKDNIVLPKIQEILSWDAAAYRQAMEDTALYWRGRTVLQRNALLLLGNRRDLEDIPLLADFLQDSRPVIRGHAAWALGQNSHPKAADSLHAAEAYEKDRQVLLEIREALSLLKQEDCHGRGGY